MKPGRQDRAMSDRLDPRPAGADQRFCRSLRFAGPRLDGSERDQEVGLGGVGITEPEPKFSGLQVRPEPLRIERQRPVDRRLGFIGAPGSEQGGRQKGMRGRVGRVAVHGLPEGLDGGLDPLVGEVPKTQLEGSTRTRGLVHSASRWTMATGDWTDPAASSTDQVIGRPNRHQAAIPIGAMIVVPTLIRTITA